MTMTASTQSLVTALGSGSGIDMAALASNLANAQFASRVSRLSTKSESLSAQISSASNIKAMLLNFASSLGEAVRGGALSPQPQIANAAVASATLTGTRQPSGTFSLEVTALARGQTLASAVFEDSTTKVGAGTLILRMGMIAEGEFTASSDQAPLEVTIAPGATLNDVADAINSKKAGVTAYVAMTPQGAQLVFKGEDGAQNGFVIEAIEDPEDPTLPGLSRLNWSPDGASGQLLQTAGDATFKVDGLARTASSNRVGEAIPGVLLTLTATNQGAPTQVSFTDTSQALTRSMTDLTGALNEIASALNAATDPNSGELRADSGARALKNKLGQLAGQVVMPNAAGAARTLADLGLSTQRDGTFKLDTARLSATLARDPEGVAAMFTNGLHGVYATIDKLYRDVSATGNPGSLGGSINRYTAQLRQVTEDQSGMAEKQEALRASLAARFTVSDTRIAQSRSTLTFIQNQIAAWNKSGD